MLEYIPPILIAITPPAPSDRASGKVQLGCYIPRLRLIRINIAACFLGDQGPEELIAETLVHELLHAYQHEHGTLDALGAEGRVDDWVTQHRQWIHGLWPNTEMELYRWD
jgi:hypothetical protein